jgi:hypothetical protein
MSHFFEGHRNLGDVRGAARLRPFHPLEEDILLGVSMLVGV